LERDGHECQGSDEENARQGDRPTEYAKKSGCEKGKGEDAQVLEDGDSLHVQTFMGSSIKIKTKKTAFARKPRQFGMEHNSRYNLWRELTGGLAIVFLLGQWMREFR
jgi:hypothetical protein